MKSIFVLVTGSISAQPSLFCAYNVTGMALQASSLDEFHFGVFSHITDVLKCILKENTSSTSQQRKTWQALISHSWNLIAVFLYNYSYFRRPSSFSVQYREQTPGCQTPDVSFSFSTLYLFTEELFQCRTAHLQQKAAYLAPSSASTLTFPTSFHYCCGYIYINPSPRCIWEATECMGAGATCSQLDSVPTSAHTYLVLVYVKARLVWESSCGQQHLKSECVHSSYWHLRAALTQDFPTSCFSLKACAGCGRDSTAIL